MIYISPYHKRQGWEEALTTALDTQIPTVVLDDSIYTPSYKYSVHGGQVRPLYRISPDAFDRQAAYIEPDGEWVSFNQAALERLEAIKSKRRQQQEAERQRQQQEAEAAYKRRQELQNQVEQWLKATRFGKAKAEIRLHPSPVSGDGTVEVEGVAAGGIIIHRHNGRYRLSHIPTGLWVGVDMPTQRLAKCAAVRLLSVGDFSSPQVRNNKQAAELVCLMQKHQDPFVPDLACNATASGGRYSTPTHRSPDACGPKEREERVNG